MGSVLSHPNLSTIVEKKAVNGFCVGLAEMNGWRNSMEDAHVIHIRPDWAFFGVFDGHGGDQCSAFVAKEFYERLERDGCPADDKAMKQICLDIDEKWLDAGEKSGTTAAMCIVHRPTQPGGKIKLRVANAGDSRVLLGKRDGTIVDGGLTVTAYQPTDQGLSRDHKPSDPLEKERIDRCGGHVEWQGRNSEGEGGVARVNGDLAVSRGFGDKDHKKTGGPDPEDRPVTADPELQEFECDESDVLILVCDGVSEGNFSNPEVVKLISESLEKDGDPGAACRATILHAEKMNSKDNITCMIVMFDGDKEADLKEEHAFTPGPLLGKDQTQFSGDYITNYEAFAKRMDIKLEEALELRYEDMKVKNASEDLTHDERQALRKELCVFGKQRTSAVLAEQFVENPAIPGEKGSDERRSYLKACVDREREPRGGGGGGGGNALMEMLLARGGGSLPAGLEGMLGGGGGGAPAVEDGRKVKASSVEALKEAVEAHPALKWDERIANVAHQEGNVMQEDTSDSTMQVKFPAAAAQMWLPTSVLEILDNEAEGAGNISAGGGYESPSASPAP